MAGGVSRKIPDRDELQPTVLVHELYLELVKVRAFSTSGAHAEEERAAFLRVAGHMMKRCWCAPNSASGELPRSGKSSSLQPANTFRNEASDMTRYRPAGVA